MNIKDVAPTCFGIYIYIYIYNTMYLVGVIN